MYSAIMNGKIFKEEVLDRVHITSASNGNELNIKTNRI